MPPIEIEDRAHSSDGRAIDGTLLSDDFGQVLPNAFENDYPRQRLGHDIEEHAGPLREKFR